jgi:Gpi18-like mannosyltransferase
MLSRQAAPTRPEPADAADAERATAPWWHGPLLFCTVGVVLWAVVALSVAHLPWSSHSRPGYFPGQPWLEGWVHWDAGWYHSIAEKGYSYVPGRQSAVAFFPAYPLAMRAGRAVVGDSLLAGILVTLGAGLTLAALLWSWLRERLSTPAAWTALALFLLYPYAYYLYGAVYADALFLAAVEGAFVLVERGHPWWAGL